MASRSPGGPLVRDSVTALAAALLVAALLVAGCSTGDGAAAGERVTSDGGAVGARPPVVAPPIVAPRVAPLVAPLVAPAAWHDRSYETPGAAKVLWELVLPSSVALTEDSLSAWLRSFVDSAERVRFAQHPRPTVVDIKVFASDAHAASGMGQWVMWWSRTPGSAAPHISFDSRQLLPVAAAGAGPEAAPGTGPGTVDVQPAGLPEAARRALFLDIVRVEDRANASVGDRAAQKAAKAAGLAALAKQHGMTTAELQAIANEGVSRSWPFPPR